MYPVWTGPSHLYTADRLHLLCVLASSATLEHHQVRVKFVAVLLVYFDVEFREGRDGQVVQGAEQQHCAREYAGVVNDVVRPRRGHALQYHAEVLPEYVCAQEHAHEQPVVGLLRDALEHEGEAAYYLARDGDPSCHLYEEGVRAQHHT